MAFISLKNFLSIWHFELIGLIDPRAVSERVNVIPYLIVRDSTNFKNKLMGVMVYF
jgi:hypothetical protein